MSNHTQRILEAIQGDTASITALAGAIARHDVGAAQEVLRARGVSITAEELGEVMRGATSEGGIAISFT